MIPNRTWIDERPVEVKDRIEPQHWEGDLLCSRRSDKTSVLVLEERASRYLLAERVPDKKPQRIAKLIAQTTSNLAFKSLTLDNGLEFKHHERFGCATFFCHPYSSWEKGGIEYANRLLRRYLPKRSYLRDYSNRYLQAAVW